MTSLDAEAPSLPDGVALGSIARRAGGLLIDQVLVVIPVFIVAVVAGVDLREDISANELLALNAAVIGIGTVYEIVGVAVFGCTVGKYLLRLRVVRSTDAGPVGWTYASVRSLVTSAAALVPTVGVVMASGVYLWAVFDPRRQGVHDKLAGTLVVQAPAAVLS